MLKNYEKPSVKSDSNCSGIWVTDVSFADMGSVTPLVDHNTRFLNNSTSFCNSLKAIKSVKQSYTPNSELQSMMEIFRQMVNYCIRIGLEDNVSTLKKLSMLSYHQLKQYDILSSYKLNAISQACGRLSQMKQSIKRSRKTKSPFVRKLYLVNCYGFKVNGCLLSIPYKRNQHINILLNSHTTEVLSDPALKVRSFSITLNGFSMSVSKEVDEIECTNTVGVDRNLRNVTVGNWQQVAFYKTSKLLSIKENTSHVMSAFRRNDARIRRRLASKLGNRRANRIRQFIHKISKDIVQNAKKTRSMIIFEDLKGVRKLYRKGNGQGRKYRRKLNSWSFFELQRQVQYKASWEGIPVRFVNPRRTSILCPRCGKRTQESREHRRKLWCINCMRLMDRDVVASLNIAYKGWTRFIYPRGGTGEAMVPEPGSCQPAIRIVDVPKLLQPKR